ncbi:unnamed protein product [Cylicocyclus nassatus]|uniref:Signal peptidase complex subunit 3 n=1 Tax=Cylicocyclus nassatus TaxID=53992 RepID=A0AA36GRJ3_CYLNA|nr:unnamed protein product [Cylicocyclus nassatus]
MYSLLVRLNAIFSFTLWTLSALLFACILTTNNLDYSTAVEITVNNPRVRSTSRYTSTECDLGLLDFSIYGDFSKIYNWNVKQLYVYLVAEYTSRNNEVNQVTLWDEILLRSKRVVLDERRLHSKYYFLDDGSNLLNHPNVTLVLRYNVVPHVGYLRLSQARGEVVVKFPNTYVNKKH